MAQFDCLVVGAGLFGATFARRAVERGLNPLVIDRRDHIGGNIYDQRVLGINVHRYGPHIFHTNNRDVWQFVNRFSRFRQYEHRVKGTDGQRVFPVPINLMTMYLLWGVSTPSQAQRQLTKSRVLCSRPRNLEEWALHHLGRDLYEMVVKGYTEKQWGRPCAELPARIIRRLPVRMTWDDRYHSDRFSGLPEEGYTQLAANLLDGIEVELGVDYLDERDEWDRRAKLVVYTGSVDSYFECCFGDLQYRSLRFETELARGDVQGCPQLNHTARHVPYTRVLEWKHFERQECADTVITKEYPQEWTPGGERFYPINDEQNGVVYEKYRQLTKTLFPRYLFGGRLGSYKYLDMDQTIAQALNYADRTLEKRTKLTAAVLDAPHFSTPPVDLLVSESTRRSKPH